MEDRTRPGRLDPETAKEVIRRAVELDAGPLDDSAGIDRRALAAAADEIGISPASVRRALAEHDAGALVRPVDRSILGPAHALAVRVVPLSPAKATGRIERFLKAQLLEVHDRRDDEVVWSRRQDLTARIRRKVDFGKRLRLSGVDAVAVSVADADDGHSLVRLEADLGHTRRGLLSGVAIAPTVAAPILGGIAAIVVHEPLLFVGGFPVGAALGSAGLYAGRRTLAHEREEAGRVLALFLDDLGRTR